MYRYRVPVHLYPYGYTLPVQYSALTLQLLFGNGNQGTELRMHLAPLQLKKGICNVFVPPLDTFYLNVPRG